MKVPTVKKVVSSKAVAKVVPTAKVVPKVVSKVVLKVVPKVVLLALVAPPLSLKTNKLVAAPAKVVPLVVVG